MENFVEGLLTGSGASRPLLCDLEPRAAQAVLDEFGFRGKAAQALADALAGLGAGEAGRQELADALQHVPPELAALLTLPSRDQVHEVPLEDLPHCFGVLRALVEAAAPSLSDVGPDWRCFVPCSVCAGGGWASDKPVATGPVTGWPSVKDADVDAV